MKLLGIITFNSLLGVLFTFLGLKSGNDFFCDFLKNQILPISATIIGFNISGVIFLIGHLIQIEGDFSNTKKEIKHNIFFMCLLFIFIILLLFINPIPFDKSIFDFIYQSLIMTLFFLQLYAVYEIINAVFNLKN